MKKINIASCLVLFRGLHSLLCAGLELVPALELQAQEHSRLARPLHQIIAGLREGQTFSKALAHSLSVPHLVWIYVQLGEKSGDLAHACQLSVTWLERQQSWKRMLWVTSFYPVVLILTSILLCWVMIGFVLPEFASLYQTLNVALPRSTAWLLGLATWAPNLGKNLMICVTILSIGIFLTWRSEQGRFHLEMILSKLPGSGRLMSYHYEYQLALQLGTLLQAGCPLLESVEFMGRNATSPLFSYYLIHVQQKIRQGQSLSSSFCHTWKQNQSFKGLLAHAEQTGRFDKMLLNLEHQRSAAFTHWQDRAKHLIQPIITLVMGGFLGIWILLLYYPMLQLGTNLG